MNIKQTEDVNTRIRYLKAQHSQNIRDNKNWLLKASIPHHVQVNRVKLDQLKRVLILTVFPNWLVRIIEHCDKEGEISFTLEFKEMFFALYTWVMYNPNHFLRFYVPCVFSLKQKK